MLCFLVKSEATKNLNGHRTLQRTWWAIIILDNNCGFIDCDVMRDSTVARLGDQCDTQSSILIEFRVIKDVYSNHDCGYHAHQDVDDVQIKNLIVPYS